MNRVSRKALLRSSCLSACVFIAACCGTPAPIVRFAGTAPAAAAALDGTYVIAFANPADASQFPPNPTLTISGGLLTMLGVTEVTPTNVANDTAKHFVWTIEADVPAPGFSCPVRTTITLDATVQADKSLSGTLVLSAQGQTADPLSLTLTK